MRSRPCWRPSSSPTATRWGRTGWPPPSSCPRAWWPTPWPPCKRSTPPPAALLQLGGHWQLATKNEYGPWVRRALETRRAAPLSNAALETLTVIAYNQPVSRAFIEQVRGVDSSSSVSGLLEKGLIEEAGRLDLPGRPVSFRTTDHFLRVFGLSSLDDLPPIHGEEEAGKEGAP